MITMKRQLTQAEKNMFISALSDMEVKAELAKNIRAQVDQASSKYMGKPPSYDALISSDVNMQNRLMSSGYEVYGRTIISRTKEVYDNESVYKKLKNKIRYRQGNAPDVGYINRGGFKFA